MSESARKITSMVATLFLFTTIAVVTDVGWADTPECEDNKESLTFVIEAIDDLEKEHGHYQLIEDSIAVIDVLLEGLKTTKEDIDRGISTDNKIIRAFDKAKAQLEKVEKGLKGKKSATTKAFKKAIDAVRSFSEDVARGIAQFKTFADRLESANKFIGKIADKLEAVKSMLVAAKAADDFKNGTAGERVRAMKVLIDQYQKGIGDKTPITPVLAVYSEMLGVIANDVEATEKAAKAKFQQARKALDGSTINLEKVVGTNYESARERARERLSLLRELRSEIEARLASNGCTGWSAPEKVDACRDANRSPYQTYDIVQKTTERQRASYRVTQASYGNLLGRLASHALNPPTGNSSSQELALIRHEGALDLLRRAAKANDLSYFRGDDPLAGAKGAAMALNVALPAASRDWRVSANTYLPLLRNALEQHKQSVRTKSAVDTAARKKTWEETRTQLIVGVKAAREKRDAAKIDLDKAIGDAIVGEAEAKKWTAAQTAEFDECFPAFARLRMAAVVPTTQAFTVKVFDPTMWGARDAEIGFHKDSRIEDFEDTVLAEGLRVELSDSIDAFGPTDSLPTAFDPTVSDPNSERAFTPGVWDGSRVLLNRRTSPPSGYADLIWSDVTFHIPGGASSFGFSLQNMDLDAELFVNNVSQGSLSSHLSTGGGRNGYLRIDAGPSEAITLVKVANGAGDGLAFDHVAFNPLPRSR